MRIATILCASTALMLPAMAAAQSSGTIATEEEEIVVTGSRTNNGVDGFVVPDAPKSRAIITQELIGRQSAGQTILNVINLVPGVNFTQSDPFGSAGGNVRIRGFDGNRISLTFDGIPLNDSGNYAIYPNQMLDSELIEQVNVNLGTTDVDSPTASAAGGTINYRTIMPTSELGGRVTGTIGDEDFTRIFGLLQTGEFTSFGTRAFISASNTTNDKFKGPGGIDKQQYNARIYQPLGGGDFISIAGHYNENRNNFYRNPGIGDLRTALGAAVIPANTAASPDTPITVGFSDLSEAQEDAVFDIENVVDCGPYPFNATNCSNLYGVRVNPSNTGNVRGNSRFSLTDKLTLTVDGAYQYTLAHGGGSTNLLENSARVRAGTTLGGVDYNGDGDFGDNIRFFTPNITNTKRYTALVSLIYDISDQHRVRLAYTYDRARHRQTGEWGFLDTNGLPENIFSGRNGRPVLDAAGDPIQQRDRLSVALLNQISGQYIGNFMDDRLRVEIGVRAPFFERDLETYCPIQARDGFAYCTNEAIAEAAGTGVPYYYVDQGEVFAGSGGSVPLYRPFAAEYKFSPILPSVGISYELVDNLSVYGSYAEGFSAPRTDNLYRAPLVTVNPETTDAFDLGIRYTSSTIQAQAAAWYIGYQNRIVTSFDADQGISVERNVGKVESYGFDASIAVKPIPELTLYALASYINAELQDNVQVGTLPAGVTSCGSSSTLSEVPAGCAPTAGRKVTETPEWQFGGRAQLNLGPLEVGLQGKWVDDRFATDTNDVVVEDYALFDLDARYSLSEVGLENTFVQLNVSNLFDERYFSNISTQINVGGNPNFTVGYPRTITAGISVGF